MPCTWLLTMALAVAGSADQGIAYPQSPSTSTAARPPRAKNPYGRLFQIAPGDRSGRPTPAPLFRVAPGKQPIRATDDVPLDGESVEIICGMSVARKSAQIDRGIALPADRGNGIAVRRVEPGLCGPGRVVVPR